MMWATDLDSVLYHIGLRKVVEIPLQCVSVSVGPDRRSEAVKQKGKPHNSTWTPKREAQLKKMWNRGTKIKTMSAKFGISDAAVRQKLERMGLMYVPKTGISEKEKAVNRILKKKGIKKKITLRDLNNLKGWGE